MPTELHIPLYHVDNSLNNQKFARGEMIDPSDEDGEWAGKGLYFWDNIGNAHYWAESRRYSNVTISRAMMQTLDEFILDLTEPESVSNFLHLAEFLLTKINRDADFSSIAEKGALINGVYESLQRLNKKEGSRGLLPQLFKVVKVNGYYPATPERDFFKVSGSRRNSPHVTLKAKVIYAVRDQTILEQREVIEEVS